LAMALRGLLGPSSSHRFHPVTIRKRPCCR
jgi:hypothetical protein